MSDQPTTPAPEQEPVTPADPVLETAQDSAAG